MCNERDLFFSRTHDWLESYLPRQAGRSPETVRSYRDSLSVFRRYVRDVLGRGVAEFTFGECGRDCVLGFVEHMRASGLSASTCNQRVAAIKSYLWYAADADVAVTSVAMSVGRIPPIKGPQRVKENLSESALRAILAAPDTTTRMGMRDAALLTLLYDTGIRLSELTGLTLGDVTLRDDMPYVFVLGKGDRERTVGLSDVTVTLVRLHVEMSHRRHPVSSDPLLYTKVKGNRCRMSSSNVERIVQKYADMAREACAEVPARVYPHMYRRTRATDLYQEGVDLPLVSRILGHASMETTKIYAKPSMEALREAMAAVAPATEAERPIWKGNEEEMARLCGLR